MLMHKCIKKLHNEQFKYYNCVYFSIGNLYQTKVYFLGPQKYMVGISKKAFNKPFLLPQQGFYVQKLSIWICGQFYRLTERYHPKNTNFKRR